MKILILLILACAVLSVVVYRYFKRHFLAFLDNISLDF